MQTLTILLVDDDEDDRDFFLMALQQAGTPASLLTADSCAEALDKLAASALHPDFIFLDLNMPMTDGKECLRELKRNADTQHIPVIIFTTSGELIDRQETRELGAIGYIIKPPTLQELTDTLTAFFNKQTINTNKNEK